LHTDEKRIRVQSAMSHEKPIPLPFFTAVGRLPLSQPLKPGKCAAKAALFD
jgi:hypothetical protein